jgi:hypothetical protein
MVKAAHVRQTLDQTGHRSMAARFSRHEDTKF